MQAKRLEDYQPGASRKQILGALSKAAKSPKSNANGKTSHAKQERSEQDKVHRAIDIVIERHLEAFKELERY